MTFPLYAKALSSLAAIAVSLTLASGAWAAEVSGVKLAERISAGSQTLVLNGAGLRKRLVFNVYVAALYTATPSHDANAIINSGEPRRLELTLLRDIDSATLMDALDDGLKDNSTAQEQAELHVPITRFKTIMISAGQGSKGDTIALDFNTAGVTVLFKGQSLGHVPSPRFAAVLMRVWLGDKPAQASLKQALLGKK